jgi:MFS family permease
MYRAQRLGLKYLTVSTVMFGAMIAFGLLSSIYYVYPTLLLNIFNFSSAKIVHRIMTPTAMVATALLLGAFVVMAGVYGLLYCASRLYDKAGLRTGKRLSYAALCAIAAAIVLSTPLHLWWKLLIAASCAAYLAIPPVTWRHLNRIHRGDTSHGSKPAQHADRALSGLFRRA